MTCHGKVNPMSAELRSCPQRVSITENKIKQHAPTDSVSEDHFQLAGKNDISSLQFHIVRPAVRIRKLFSDWTGSCQAIMFSVQFCRVLKWSLHVFYARYSPDDRATCLIIDTFFVITEVQGRCLLQCSDKTGLFVVTFVCHFWFSPMNLFIFISFSQLFGCYFQNPRRKSGSSALEIPGSQDIRIFIKYFLASLGIRQRSV